MSVPAALPATERLAGFGFFAEAPFALFPTDAPAGFVVRLGTPADFAG